jgi:predicted enzyme involved in methoxymalonyl-ACP biosynthesis
MLCRRRSQELTADRVLVNMDNNVHLELINSRFADVSISRAAQDTQVYTDFVASLPPSLNHAVTKSSALSRAQTIAAGLSL